MQTPAARGRQIRKQSRSIAESSVYNKIQSIIAARLAGKQVMRGDTMAELVRRHCVEAFQVAAENNLRLDVDLPENQRPAPFEEFEVFFILKPVLAEWDASGLRPN